MSELEVEELDFVDELNEHDILCGRGGGSFKHLGNTTYRHLVNLNKVRSMEIQTHFLICGFRENRSFRTSFHQPLSL